MLSTLPLWSKKVARKRQKNGKDPDQSTFPLEGPTQNGNLLPLGRTDYPKSRCAQGQLHGLIPWLSMRKRSDWAMLGVTTQELPFPSCQHASQTIISPDLILPLRRWVGGWEHVYNLKVKRHLALVPFPTIVTLKSNISSSSSGLLSGGNNIHLHNLCQQPRCHVLPHPHICPSFTLWVFGGEGVLSSPSSPHGPTLGPNLASRICLYAGGPLLPVQLPSQAPRETYHVSRK